MNSSDIENQTLFSEEQPFFDADGFGRKFNEKNGKRKSKKPLFIFATVIVVILMVGTLTFMRLFPRNTVVNQPNVSPSPTPNASMSPLDVLFVELDQDIQNADPSKNVLPFPPVADTITVSPENR